MPESLNMFGTFHNNNLSFLFSVAARKADILRVTEQILDAINNGDFDTYTYVYLDYYTPIH
jgi:Calcium/calmodulin dependent protein kinase II association domain